jgi:hypothetical protein
MREGQQMNNYHRFIYHFWVFVLRLGHSLFRLGQWQSLKAQDKIGGRHRKETRPIKIALDFIRISIYNIYVATRVAIKKLK